MNTTHRVTRDIHLCGNRLAIAAGTEVELLRVRGDEATVKPDPSVVQVVPLDAIEELK